jgi:cytochrome c553
MPAGQRTGPKTENMTMKTTKTALLVAATFALSVTLSQAEEAKVLFEKNCASCHGKDAKGQTTMGKKNGVKDYSVLATWEGVTDEKAFKAVKEGLEKDGKSLMKPFAEKLTDDDIKAVNAYMKSLAK